MSENETDFKEQLRSYVLDKIKNLMEEDRIGYAAGKRILRLIEYDGKVVDELSMEKQLKIETMTLLWHFLNNDFENVGTVDLYWDLYHHFDFYCFLN
jgi:lysine 2,3-aminomutase